MKEKKSSAYELIAHIWGHEALNSYVRLNGVLHSAMNLAITANLTFDENDIHDINVKFNGGYWFGDNGGGKGYPSTGGSFYATACRSKNMTAIKSFEKYFNLTPFILNGNRLHIGFQMRDEKMRRIRVTGFDLENNKVMLVSYNPSDREEKGKRKLNSYTNKEWLKIRKIYK